MDAVEQRSGKRHRGAVGCHECAALGEPVAHRPLARRAQARPRVGADAAAEMVLALDDFGVQRGVAQRRISPAYRFLSNNATRASERYGMKSVSLLAEKR